MLKKLLQLFMKKNEPAPKVRKHLVLETIYGAPQPPSIEETLELQKRKLQQDPVYSHRTIEIDHLTQNTELIGLTKQRPIYHGLFMHLKKIHYTQHWHTLKAYAQSQGVNLAIFTVIKDTQCVKISNDEPGSVLYLIDKNAIALKNILRIQEIPASNTTINQQNIQETY